MSELNNNKHNVLISVILPTYNSQKTIERTLVSVINQSYKKIEVIIVDDFSNDNTKSIIRKFQMLDDRIKFIQKEKNRGVADSRNIGIKLSKGNYVAFIDSDDVWEKNKIETQLNYMTSNNILFSYTNYCILDDLDTPIGLQTTPRKISYNSALFGNMIGCSTVMFNLKLVGKIYIPNLKKRNDAALWLKILKISQNGYRAPGVNTIYYKNSNSLSSGSKLSLLKYHYQVYNESENFNFLTSIFFVGSNIFKFLYKRLFYFKKI